MHIIPLHKTLIAYVYGNIQLFFWSKIYLNLHFLTILINYKALPWQQFHETHKIIIHFDIYVWTSLFNAKCIHVAIAKTFIHSNE